MKRRGEGVDRGHQSNRRCSRSPATRPSPKRCGRSTRTSCRRVPDHAADRDRAEVRPVRGQRQGRHRVHHRRERALGDERRHRLRGRRRAHHDRHLLAGPRPHVGDAVHRRRATACRSSCPTSTAPCRPDQHPLRPLRLHGRAATPAGSSSTARAHQEAYDNHLMAFRIAEHPDVRTPVMTMTDGFIISGAIGPLQELETSRCRSSSAPTRRSTRCSTCSTR